MHILELLSQNRLLAGFLALVFLTGISNPFKTLAQPPQETAPQEPAIPIKLTADGLDAASVKDVLFSDPTSVKLVTKDNVEISATFYGGIHGKNTPALILIHDLGGKAEDLTQLAGFLQRSYGYAVLVPDLRGHGKSVSESQKKIDVDKMNRAEFDSLGYDIEACKKFLVTRNDSGELNIDMLTVVAVGKTCITAVNWCLGDWSFPPLGGQRQGQDVKAVVLVSPEESFKGSRMNTAIRAGLFTGKDFPNPIRVLLAVGKDDDALLDEAEKIRAVIARHRNLTDGVVDGLFVLPDYDQNGTKLIKSQGNDFPTMIATLVFMELFQKSNDFPWQVRGKK